MTFVTLFALVGDDIRCWITSKFADPYFDGGLVLSFFLFTAEILTSTVVVDEFKYSFFFWLDIIATLSLIPDIAWLEDLVAKLLFDSYSTSVSVDVILG